MLITPYHRSLSLAVHNEIDQTPPWSLFIFGAQEDQIYGRLLTVTFVGSVLWKSRSIFEVDTSSSGVLLFIWSLSIFFI